MRVLFALIFFSITASISAQNLNNYKYIRVPETFEVFSDKDKYQMNALTEFLFEKYGFNAIYLEEEIPEDVAKNNCLALTVDLEKNNNLFFTRIKVVLKDCENKIVFKSIEGSSKEKLLKKAYQEALREAFVSFEELDYKYNGTVDKKIGESPAPTNSVSTKLSENDIEKVEPVSDDPIKTKKAVSDVQVLENNTIRYEVAMTAEGFSLYNSKTNEFIGKGLESSREGVYNFISEKFKGIAFFDDNGNVIVEYTENDQIKTKLFKLQ